MKNQDKIFKAIERITGKHIVYFHDEVNRYAFKYWATGEWGTLDKNFVHDFAGI